MKTVLRTFWLLAALVLAGAAGTAVVWVAKGHVGDTEGRIISSLIGIFLSLAAAVAGLQLVELRRLRLLAAVAIAAVPLELAAFIAASWYGEFGDGSNNAVKWFPTGLAWVIASLVVTTLALLVRDRRLLRTLLPATLLVAVAGASVATVMLWTDVDENAWGRALACLAIVMAACWLLAPLVQQLIGPQNSTRT